jgi:hypothetical protein
MSNISELQVLKSAAGYYIGRTQEKANELLNPNPNTKLL